MKRKRDQIYVDRYSGELRVLTYKHLGRNPVHSSGVILPFNGAWFAKGTDPLTIYVIDEESLRLDYEYVGAL